MFFAVASVVAVVSAVLTAGNAAASVRSPAVPAARAGTAVPAAGTWGKLVDLTGTGLNSGGSAAVTVVSCSSAGNCSAGGYYANAAGSQMMVVTEAGGTWGTAKELPGSGTLNKGGDAGVDAISCASAGNCAVGGSCRDASGHSQVLVDTQVSGKWGTAQQVPGLATLNAGNTAFVNSLSCPSAGNCSAGGYYRDGSGHAQALRTRRPTSRRSSAAAPSQCR